MSRILDVYLDHHIRNASITLNLDSHGAKPFNFTSNSRNSGFGNKTQNFDESLVDSVPFNATECHVVKNTRAIPSVGQSGSKARWATL